MPLNIFRRFREKREAKHRYLAALKLGREAGGAMAAAVDEYLDPRLTRVSDGLLKVLEDRLRAISEEPRYTPQQVGQLELKIFMEQLGDMLPRMQDEVAEHLSAWRALADQTGVTDTFTMYVKQKVDTAKLNLVEQAINMTGEAVIQANGRNSSSGGQG